MQVGMELGGYWRSDVRHIDDLFPEMVEVVQHADKLGLDAFVCGEHHFMDYGATPSPMMVLCHLAPMIKAPRLQASILMVPMHQPEILAGEVALADQLTGGRLEIGVSRGGAPYEYVRACEPSDKEITRKIFEERLEAMKKLFTETNVSFKGEYCEFEDVTIMPPVRQKPYPPIWLTCMRTESVFHVAKNGYNVQTSSLRQPMSYIREMMQAFRDGCAESAKPKGEQEISLLQWVYVAKDDADAREKLEMAYEKQQKFTAIFTGSKEISSGIIPPIPLDTTVDDLASGVVIGTKDYVEDRLLEIKEAGFDMLAMKTSIGMTHTDEMKSLDRLAEHILPALKADEMADTSAV